MKEVIIAVDATIVIWVLASVYRNILLDYQYYKDSKKKPK